MFSDVQCRRFLCALHVRGENGKCSEVLVIWENGKQGAPLVRSRTIVAEIAQINSVEVIICKEGEPFGENVIYQWLSYCSYMIFIAYSVPIYFNRHDIKLMTGFN